MARTIWHGSFYKRQQDSSWRQRGTGFVVRNPPKIIQRKGNNLVIVGNGSNWKGVEIPRKNYYGSDPRQLRGRKVIFQNRVRSATERKAMFARMKRR